ncbi:phosphatidylserine decarboxylase precursor-related protein [Thermanaerovibrio velox DSM 12556]|uniref:Phosphatidylserine decarboxylase proenzyme n=1 Tax=Thermanaerovibrio velox DSM 12556 TaxID=926567 RepID=H0UPS5_9BACT|nr:phosphatidylserine decarboxylase [Thermanaerovibrio velox]EHM10634.1 phosphatidylserine decarboxylase precursor-related protein [Thermanaerovibrio velox DSM 12556]
MINRHGLPSVGAVVFMMAGAWLISRPLSFALALPLLFLLWFYRDPERRPPEDPALWVSPADGKVVELEQVNDPVVGPSTKVGIFMSPLDVHVNRMPFEGEVFHLRYVPGRKWLAFEPKASENNERLYVGVRTPHGDAMLVQIAGLLARRIVAWAPVGSRFSRGDRYGMIKLGSKVDLYLPPSVEPLVKLGQRVKAGETPVGVVRR